MLTDEQIDAVIRTEPAAVYELLQTDGTAASIREALRLIARNVEREAYKRAAAECQKIADRHWAAYKGRGPAAEPNMRGNPYIEGESDGAGECAVAIEALGREE